MDMDQICVCVIVLLFCDFVKCQFLAQEHKTHAAAEKVNDLWCYTCHAMDSEDTCVELLGNHSSLIKKCRGENRTCMVKRFSYTTSTENTTSVPRMWSLERNCTEKCEPGCIVIGERTKLYACTSCCVDSLCNTDKGAASSLPRHTPLVLAAFVSTLPRLTPLAVDVRSLPALWLLLAYLSCLSVSLTSLDRQV